MTAIPYQPFCLLSLLHRYLRTAVAAIFVAAVGVIGLGAVGVQANSPLEDQPAEAEPSDAAVDPVTDPGDGGLDANLLVDQPVTDPLNSPYPVPWGWIVETQAEYGASPTSDVHFYRTPALVSPDGDHAVYSRIQLHLLPEPIQDRVSSILFLEDLETGELEFVTASSPTVRNPYIPEDDYQQPGMIAILMPATWSEDGDRVLVRAFESLFGTDLASDHAVIWNENQDRIQAFAPSDVVYSNAVLLGWSQERPNQVLFQAGMLGDAEWPTLAVDPTGQTVTADSTDEPVVFGSITENFWSGPQAVR